MKKCTKCGVEKELEEFHKNKNKKDGRQSYCIKCVSIRKVEKEIFEEGYKRCFCCKEIKKHSEFYNTKMRSGKRGKDSYCKICRANDRKEYFKEYLIKNKEELNLKSKKYRENNSEKRSETCKNYRNKNKEKIKINNKIYLEKNKIKIKERSKIYYQNNKKEIMEKQKSKLSDNPKLRIIKNYRKRTWEVLINGCKSATTIELIGCTPEEFHIHIENQFQEGMTWENYGEWHVDHIRPIFSFSDLTDPQQQRECFNYKNCRPLWAKENLSRSKTKWNNESIDLNNEIYQEILI